MRILTRSPLSGATRMPSAEIPRHKTCNRGAVRLPRRFSNLPAAGPTRHDSHSPPGGSGPSKVAPTMNADIRPTLHTLRRLPTLHQVEETWGRIELKLETPDTRYWLT